MILFESQALLEIFISFGFIIVAINAAQGISALEILGVIIFLGALWGETIADEQLQNFKKDPNNRGKLCQAGLWQYSRHPNYFFDQVATEQQYHEADAKQADRSDVEVITD